MCNGRSVRHTATSQPLSNSNRLAASTIAASVAGGSTSRLSTTSTRHRAPGSRRASSSAKAASARSRANENATPGAPRGPARSEDPCQRSEHPLSTPCVDRHIRPRHERHWHCHREAHTLFDSFDAIGTEMRDVFLKLETGAEKFKDARSKRLKRPTGSATPRRENLPSCVFGDRVDAMQLDRAWPALRATCRPGRSVNRAAGIPRPDRRRSNSRFRPGAGIPARRGARHRRPDIWLQDAKAVRSPRRLVLGAATARANRRGDPALGQVESDLEVGLHGRSQARQFVRAPAGECTRPVHPPA